MLSWETFGEWMSKGNGIDVSCLTEHYEREQREYLMKTALWANVSPEDVIGSTFTISNLDTHTVSLEEIKTMSSQFDSIVTQNAELTAFAGWFDVQFNGSRSEPSVSPTSLTTAPGSHTHWGQQVFLCEPPIDVLMGDTISGSIKLTRQKSNHRLLYMEMQIVCMRCDAVQSTRTLTFRID